VFTAGVNYVLLTDGVLVREEYEREAAHGVTDAQQQAVSQPASHLHVPHQRQRTLLRHLHHAHVISLCGTLSGTGLLTDRTNENGP
jgi:hypothetical protein